jgi:hypothetical protein
VPCEQRVGDLRGEEPLQLAGPNELAHLLLDPSLQLRVETCDLGEMLDLEVAQALLRQHGTDARAE